MAASAPIPPRRNPLLDGVPSARRGSTPGDWGLLSNLSDDAAAALRSAEPLCATHLRRYLGNAQVVGGPSRWCLLLDGVAARQLRFSSEVGRRLDEVAERRRRSKLRDTKAAADEPWRFVVTRQPTTRYLALPTSAIVAWGYLPAAIHEVDVVAGDGVIVVEGDETLMAGITMSRQFFIWATRVGTVEGGRVRISVESVYNTFPFPELDLELRQAIESAARGVLASRSYFMDRDLVDLYDDPEKMPVQLARAHEELDSAVAGALGLDTAASDEVVFTALANRHAELTPMAAPAGRRRRAA